MIHEHRHTRHIYINATLEEKQLLLRMIIDEITYAEGGILQVKL